jgi:hypothetical protein
MVRCRQTLDRGCECSRLRPVDHLGAAAAPAEIRNEGVGRHVRENRPSRREILTELCGTGGPDCARDARGERERQEEKIGIAQHAGDRGMRDRRAVPDVLAAHAEDLELRGSLAGVDVEHAAAGQLRQCDGEPAERVGLRLIYGARVHEPDGPTRRRLGE